MKVPLSSPAIGAEQRGGEEAGKMEILPAVAAYDGIDLYTITDKGRGIISPSADAKIDTLLLYYGKYVDWDKERLKKGEPLEYDESLYCPICLALDVQKLMEDGKIGEIFPFDPKSHTGSGDPEDYQIENSLEELFRYIRIYYGSVDNYLNGTAEYCPEPDDVEMCTLKGDALRRLHDRRDFNEKAQTISMRPAEEIELVKYLKCIIMPQKAKRFFQPLLSASHIECLEYKTVTHRAPTFYNAIIYQVYMKYIGKEVKLYD